MYALAFYHDQIINKIFRTLEILYFKILNQAIAVEFGINKSLRFTILMTKNNLFKAIKDPNESTITLFYLFTILYRNKFDKFTIGRKCFFENT